MSRIQWKYLAQKTCSVDKLWVIFEIPWKANEWKLGPIGYSLKQCNLPNLLPNEIAVSTQQGTNITLSREIPFRCMRKVLSIALIKNGIKDENYLDIGRVNLNRYFYYDIHGIHPFVDLINVMMTLIWLHGSP